MKLCLEKRIDALEKGQPQRQGYAERILSACTDEELDHVGEIAERIEKGIQPTQEEFAFLDSLEDKYGHC
jgi:hypothetical protein